MFHLRLGCLCFLQFDVQLLEFGLRATKLRHCFIVIHLFDLIVLELLLIQLLVSAELLDAVQSQCTALFLD